MTVFHNECVSCPDGLPCKGVACPNCSVPHVACDECGTEDTETEDGIFSYDGDELCLRCLLSRLIEDKAIRSVNES